MLRSLKRWLDPWSVPHFLFGMVLALAGITFYWPLVVTFLALVILAFLWEYIERQVGIHESKGNPKMDVVLPILAFWATFLLVDRAPLHKEQHMALFICVLLLFIFLNLVAWRARLQKEKGFLR